MALSSAIHRHVRSALGQRTGQRALVALMFGVISRLLAAASRADDEVRAEVAGFPEGLVLGFSVLGSDDLRMRVRVRAGAIELAPPSTPAQLDLVFKHLRHAFLVFSFQESTPRAFANQRVVVQGDTALAMRFVRCLNRVQAVSLPEQVARRALKSVPALDVGEKLSINARLLADMARSQPE